MKTTTVDGEVGRMFATVYLFRGGVMEFSSLWRAWTKAVGSGEPWTRMFGGDAAACKSFEGTLSRKGWERIA